MSAKSAANMGIIDLDTPPGRRFEFSEGDAEWGIIFAGVHDGSPKLFFEDGRDYAVSEPNGVGPTVDEWNADYAETVEGLEAV